MTSKKKEDLTRLTEEEFSLPFGAELESLLAQIVLEPLQGQYTSDFSLQKPSEVRRASDYSPHTSFLWHLRALVAEQEKVETP